MDAFLLESGDFLLIESGDKLLLEELPTGPMYAADGHTVVVGWDWRAPAKYPIDDGGWLH